MWLLDRSEHIHGFDVFLADGPPPKITRAEQRRRVDDPVRIVTIALNGRINDWPPGGQVGDTAQTWQFVGSD
jgi:hypothetical protein